MVMKNTEKAIGNKSRQHTSINTLTTQRGMVKIPSPKQENYN